MGDRDLHHIVDPRTGDIAEPIWRAVTVVAETAELANTAATAAIVLGTQAPGWLARRGLPARLISRQGLPVYVGNWPEEDAVDRRGRHERGCSGSSTARPAWFHSCCSAAPWSLGCSPPAAPHPGGTGVRPGGPAPSLSLVMVVGVAVHVLTSIVETYVDIGWLSLVVPFTPATTGSGSGWAPSPSTWLVAIIVTSLLRRRIPHALGRLVHWSAYALWPIALLHGIGSPTSDGPLV